MNKTFKGEIMKNIKFSKVILGLAITSAFVFANDDLKAYEELCEEKGYALFCSFAGALYHSGQLGGKQDYKKALKYYTKACEAKGDSEDKFSSCTQLGLMYFFGQGVEKNLKKAVELYEKACDGKNSNGCLGLADAYDNGIGVKQDKIKAAAMYKKACDIGKDDAGIQQNQDLQKVWQYACNKYEILK